MYRCKMVLVVAGLFMMNACTDAAKNASSNDVHKSKSASSNLLGELEPTIKALPIYIDSKEGDDANDGHVLPWKSIDRLNAAFSAGFIVPGSTILFKRNGVYYGSININVSGTPDNPISFSAYGDGAKPEITGFETIQNWWIQSSPGVWDSPCYSCQSQINAVSLDGKNQGMGRFPNADAPNKGLLTYDRTYEQNLFDYLTARDYSDGHNWSGADAVIHKREWVLDRAKIFGQYGNIFQVSDTTGFPLITGWGFFIQNHRDTLDQYGEWYYNPSNKTISMYFGPAGPSGKTVNVSTVENLINANSQSYLQFDNLNFTGPNDTGLNLSSSSQIRVTNSDFSFSGRYGFHAKGLDHLFFEDNTISDSNNSGFFCEGCSSASAVRNKLTNNGMIAGSSYSYNPQYSALLLMGPGNNLVSENTVINSGHTGITFMGENVTVSKNLVDGFGYTLTDVGGIYTWGQSNLPNRKITGNIIRNGVGDTSPCIYTDDASANVLISGNTLSQCNTGGIYLHNSHEITVYNNTFYDNRGPQLRMVHDEPFPDHPIRNINVANNIFVMTNHQVAIGISSAKDDIALAGSFSGNIYSKPMGDDALFYVDDASTEIQQFGLNTWQAKYNFDATSYRNNWKTPTYTFSNVSEQSEFTNSGFDSSLGGVACMGCDIGWLDGKLDGGTLQATAGAPTPNGKFGLILYAEKVIGGRSYVLRFSSVGSSSKTLSAYLRRNEKTQAGNFDILGETAYFDVGTQRTEHEVVFNVPTHGTTNAVIIIIEMDQQGAPIWFDNVRLLEATATPIPPSQYLRLDSNATSTVKAIQLDQNYVDVGNNPYSGNLVLQPFTSTILKKTGEVTTVPIIEPSMPELPGHVSGTILFKNHNLYTLTGAGEVARNGETITAGGVTQFVIMSNGVIYGLGEDGAIYRTLPYFPWEKISGDGAVLQFSLTDDNVIYGVGYDYNIYFTFPFAQWRGPYNPWTLAQALSEIPKLVGHKAGQVQVFNGSTYAINGQGKIARDGEVISTAHISQMVIGSDGRMYGLGLDGAIYRAYPNQAWVKFTAPYVVYFSVTAGGQIFAIGTDGNMYGTLPNGDWFRVK